LIFFFSQLLILLLPEQHSIIHPSICNPVSSNCILPKTFKLSLKRTVATKMKIVQMRSRKGFGYFRTDTLHYPSKKVGKYTWIN
jgi:hypothetical protein